MESAVANLVRPGTPGARRRRRQVRRALDRARRGLRRRRRPLRAGLGRAPRPGRVRPPAGRERRHRGRLRHAERDLDRHRPRRPGDRRGRASATARSSSSTPSPASAPPSCARTSGAIDVVVAGSQKALMCPPGLGFASRLPARARLRRAAAGRPLLLRLGQEPSRPSARATRPFTPAVSLFLGLDVALDMIDEEGLENVFARHDLLARATRAGAPGDRARALRRPRRALTVVTAVELPDVDRRRQDPGRPAQARHHRQRRPEPAQGPDPADRPLRLLRRLRHPHLAVRARDGRSPSSATRSSTAPASAPRSASSSRPASPRRRERLSSSAVHGPRQGEDRRLRRRTCCASASTSTSGVDWTDEELARAHRRLPRHPDPLGDAADRRPDRARRQPAGDRPRRRRASTTSTSRPPPSAASSSPTRRSRTSSPPPSTRSR